MGLTKWAFVYVCVFFYVWKAFVEKEAKPGSSVCVNAWVKTSGS